MTSPVGKMNTLFIFGFQGQRGAERRQDELRRVRLVPHI